MHTDYRDIIARAGDPVWWDEYAVPRYCVFEPNKQNVYANEVALVKVLCARCQKVFLIGRTHDSMDDINNVTSIKQDILDHVIGYGMPPFHFHDGHLCSGSTMTCDVFRVMEYWHREALGNWIRDRSLEIDLV
jgi:hypothetical protein